MRPTSNKTVWDLSPLLQGDTDSSFEEKMAKASQAADRFVANWQDNRTYLGDVGTLKTALDEYELLYAIHGTAGAPEYYFGLRSTQEENNPDIKARLNKTNEQSLENHNKLQFFELSLSTLPAEKLQEFIDSPELADYRHFLERLAANASHLLSEAEERILALKSQPSHGNWVQMLSGQLSERQRETVDEQGERKSRTLPELSSMLQSTDKEVRDQAAAAINQIIYEIREIAEAELNSVLLNKKINDQLRSMSRPDLGRHLSDDIDSVTVDSLVEAVAEGFPLVHRYYRLKASLLGLPSLAYHERNVPYGTDNSKYEYDEAVQIVKSAFVKLDPEFASIFQSFLDNGQIDVFPRPGKRGGAFCTHDLKVFPTYILLNHTD
ncbi:MAG: hypothetical protein K0S20_721, partial [Patescibacteria group bacterium]|nr:hypothetical protein [Patescibacteria group bacterium]